ncbi:hypothetical protein ACJX0J_030449, partial [Zea mays]
LTKTGIHGFGLKTSFLKRYIPIFSVKSAETKISRPNKEVNSNMDQKYLQHILLSACCLQQGVNKYNMAKNFFEHLIISEAMTSWSHVLVELEFQVVKFHFNFIFLSLAFDGLYFFRERNSLKKDSPSNHLLFTSFLGGLLVGGTHLKNQYHSHYNIAIPKFITIAEHVETKNTTKIFKNMSEYFFVLPVSTYAILSFVALINSFHMINMKKTNMFYWSKPAHF